MKLIIIIILIEFIRTTSADRCMSTSSAQCFADAGLVQPGSRMNWILNFKELKNYIK